MLEYNSSILKKAHAFTMCLFLLFASSCKEEEKYINNPISNLEVNYKHQLQLCIAYLDSLSNTNNSEKKVEFYVLARNKFKAIEPILSFVDKNNYKSLNQPNILKVEEEDATDIKKNKPFGFQVIEEQLFEGDLSEEELNQNITKTESRLRLIENNIQLQLKDYHILWLIRDEIIRVALTGITGFDSPVFERSLDEAKINYEAIQAILEVYKINFSDKELFKSWEAEITKTIEALNTDFNSLDRYSFIKNHTHKQLKLILETKADWKTNFPFELAFKNDVTSLFSNETFNIDFFSDYKAENSGNSDIVKLGNQLFNDKRLSINNDMSCATCHHSDKAFADGLKTFPKQIRNTPTLNYSALQQSYFYDGRAGSLEGQVAAVVKNKNEFHSDLETMKKAVESDSSYVNAFRTYYKGKVNYNSIRNAIATYIRSLSPFNSKFDNNINDLEQTLTDNEKNGFNLFMGKAKCATCHFAPLFNGTVPPNYNESEFELLGVPKDTLNPTEVDTDLGRYDLFKTEERKHFFKTPTVRNVAKTAPYMHNGVYMTLEQVIEFYNNGGGSGLGIVLEFQTLPSDSLNLTENEIKDIISFMNGLTDNNP
ncbi:cytochrome-c peroxidase [Winogradskyella ursingii]|uniref:cytochrome-c peroxidase n=1 Tax=Winogradskyella ursingii TaxID=2686079 RepID=UPI0015C71C51|nr:cytochrome c peroxidase [Winogradskyella ursingii]